MSEHKIIKLYITSMWKTISNLIKDKNISQTNKTKLLESKENLIRNAVTLLASCDNTIKKFCGKTESCLSNSAKSFLLGIKKKRTTILESSHIELTRVAILLGLDSVSEIFEKEDMEKNKKFDDTVDITTYQNELDRNFLKTAIDNAIFFHSAYYLSDTNKNKPESISRIFAKLNISKKIILKEGKQRKTMLSISDILYNLTKTYIEKNTNTIIDKHNLSAFRTELSVYGSLYEIEKDAFLDLVYGI